MNFLSRFRKKNVIAQPEGLIRVLTDGNAPLGDRIDAASDLGQFDSSLEALIEVATTGGEDEWLVEHCGESIGDIWKRNSSFDQTVFSSLPVTAQREIALYFPEAAR